MGFGLGTLRLAPDAFWRMTPRELAAAMEAVLGSREAALDRCVLRGLARAISRRAGCLNQDLSRRDLRASLGGQLIPLTQFSRVPELDAQLELSFSSGEPRMADDSDIDDNDISWQVRRVCASARATSPAAPTHSRAPSPRRSRRARPARRASTRCSSRWRCGSPACRSISRSSR